MKKITKRNSLPAAVAGLGGIALVLRRLLYLLATDIKNLLTANHPLEITLGCLTGAAMVYLLLRVWKSDGSNLYENNFAPSRTAFYGHCAAAAGIALTVLTRGPVMFNYLGTAWSILGGLAPVCLVAAGWCRMEGKRPFFLLHLIPCLFLVFHIINHYQVWSGNPQFQDYGFALFGTMALMFFAYYTAAFDVEAGRRRMYLGMGLGAVYLCLAELGQTRYPWLYLGGILWVLSDLCTLDPVPKTPEELEKKDKKKKNET